MDPNDNPNPEGETNEIDAALAAATEEASEDVIAGLDEALAAAEPAATEQPAAIVPAEGDDAAAAAADAAKPDPDPAAAAAAVEKPDAAADPDAEIAAEAKSLDLKGKANERFVAMATEIKGFAPLKAALEAAGIKDAASLPGLVEKSRAADDMIAMVMETGATSEQYGHTLDYLANINRGAAGDAKAAETAWTMWLEEGKALSKLFGKELPGIADPLADHPDLQAEVTAGDTSRARALEIAQHRALTVRQSQHQEQQAGQAQQQQAQDQGRAALIEFDRNMSATDPTYQAKRQALDGMVSFIRKTLPPAQWLAATQQAYQNIPTAAAPAAPEQQRKPAPGPMRPGGTSRTLTPQVFDNPMDAVDAALGSLTT